MQAAIEALKDMCEWFNTETAKSMRPAVAIYDATNSSKARRRMIQDFCDGADIHTLFIETICNDQEIILANVRDVKISSPDYAHTNPDQAAQDFLNRIAHYERKYETIDENDLSFVKVPDRALNVMTHLRW